MPAWYYVEPQGGMFGWNRLLEVLQYSDGWGNCSVETDCWKDFNTAIGGAIVWLKKTAETGSHGGPIYPTCKIVATRSSTTPPLRSWLRITRGLQREYVRFLSLASSWSPHLQRPNKCLYTRLKNERWLVMLRDIQIFSTAISSYNFSFNTRTIQQIITNLPKQT